MTPRQLLRSVAAFAAGGAILAVAAAAGTAPDPDAAPGNAEGMPRTVTGTLMPDGTVQLDFAAVRSMMAAQGGSSKSKSDFPDFKDVSEGFEKVISTADGSRSLYTIWTREKDGQMLAELPAGYERQRHFIATTVASGDLFAGLQSGERYVYWRRYNDQLALIQPEMGTRSSGDRESRDSVERLFTDRVLATVPIVAMGPSGQPVIDLDGLLGGRAGLFFGGQAAGANTSLVKIKTAKAFPENIEVALEMPVRGGQLRTFHYSISVIPERTGYTPRRADPRIGYFTTSYRDLGEFEIGKKWVRYINRWHLEKADPSLKMSPPKEPIVFYIEHTTPVRYRRFVREGLEVWNEAFERVGITGAIEVRQQDAASGAHMDKDPEDRRYNFVRWLSNDIGTAIGPSRVDPRTGQILDADIILTDGWIRAFWYRFNELIPDLAVEGMNPEQLAWLARNPRWDPRVQMAAPSDRERVAAQIAHASHNHGGHAAFNADPEFLGDDLYDGLAGRVSQCNGLCTAAEGKAFDMAVMRMVMDAALTLDLVALSDTVDDPEMPEEMIKALREKLASGEIPEGLIPAEVLAQIKAYDPDEDPEDPEEGDEEEKDEDKPKKDDKPESPEDQLIDGVPAWFVGPALRELVAHEAGHTLGLRHNFAASTVYTLDEINSAELKDQKPWSVSVMDYNGTNIRIQSGEKQGDYSVIDIGPYDHWAIEFGYAMSDKDAKKVFENVGEPEFVYATDEDTWGPDPRARRYDMSANPIDYAREQVALAEKLRSQILDKFVKEGDSWARARRGYAITLGLQTRANSMMANWLGGAFVHRDLKGDLDRTPIEVVDADKQREALNFVIENTFRDESYGLTPELLAHMTVDKWWDDGGDIMSDATWPIHDNILGVQGAAMTMILNPTTLQRIYDNEFRVPNEEDALTLAEVLDTVTGSIWTEIESQPRGTYTNREPMISSLRRNLQREHIERMIDLSMPGQYGAAYKPISNLAIMHLRDLHKRIGSMLEGNRAGRLDAYSRAHLSEAEALIAKSLDSEYIYNASDIGGGGLPMFLFMQQQAEAQRQAEREAEQGRRGGE